MTQATTKISNYQTDFRNSQSSLNADRPAWYRELQENAWSSFAELGFPTARRGNERWKYTNVAPIARNIFGFSANLDPDLVQEPGLQKLTRLDATWTKLVFVDGRFSGRLSGNTGNGSPSKHGINVTSIAAALGAENSGVEQFLAHQASYLDDGFTALNTAFFQDGALIQVPDGYTADSTVHLIFVTTGRDQPRASYPRTLVSVGKN